MLLLLERSPARPPKHAAKPGADERAERSPGQEGQAEDEEVLDARRGEEAEATLARELEADTHDGVQQTPAEEEGAQQKRLGSPATRLFRCGSRARCRRGGEGVGGGGGGAPGRATPAAGTR